MSNSFQNIYYKRTAGTPKSCYICYKPTTTVLATINAIDFVYTCDTHLSDRQFASRAAEDGAAKPSVPQSEIDRVKQEYEEKQKEKKKIASQKSEEQEKGEKDKGKETDGKEKQKEKDSSSSWLKMLMPSPSPASPPPPLDSSSESSAKAVIPIHTKFILHRDIFAMRQSEHRKVRQATAAKELAPRLPGVPHGGV